MNPFERFILWGMFIAIVGAGLACQTMYEDYVKPLLEIRERIERIENLINKLPINPFREDGDDQAGTLDSLPTDELRNLRDEAQAIIERRNAGNGPNGQFQQQLNEFLNPGHVKRAA